MKKLLFNGVKVLIASSIIYVVAIFSFLNIGLENWLPNVFYPIGGPGHTLLRLNEAEQKQQVEVLFVGSSHVSRGFDPRIFEKRGIDIFNLGSQSQTPFVSYFLLREYLPQLKPKYVVLDLYWEMLSRDGVESGVDIVANSKLNENIIEMVWESDNALLYNGLLISAGIQLFSPLDTADQIEFVNSVYVDGGFSQSLNEENEFKAEELKSLPKYEFQAASNQLEYLNKIIKLCEENGVKLVLTVTPVTTEYKNSLENYSEYAGIIDSVARTNNLWLIDYNREQNLALVSTKDFVDVNHLSQTGVIKFNNKFIDDLLKNKAFALAVAQ